MTSFRWVSGAVYGIVLAAGVYYAVAGLGEGTPLRLAGFVGGIACLAVLDATEHRSGRAPLLFLAVRLALFVGVAALDESGLSRALFVLVPFTAYLTFGRKAGLTLGALCLTLLTGGLALWVPNWYREATYLSDLLMFTMGLVLAIAMAEVATRERRSAETIAELSAETERTRVARDIHDSLGHHLTAIAIQLEKAEAFQARDPKTAQQALSDARNSTQRALREVRTSVGKLRTTPTTLRKALGELTNQDAQVKLTTEGKERPLAQATITTLHRTAQEAITNARRHGKATTVTVKVTYTRTAVSLKITDNGKGFNPRVPHEGYGLKGLRERATLAGGNCTVTSSPGEGTSVTVTVP